MGTIYDRAEIYDLLETPEREAVNLTHWKTLLAGKSIRSFLDVSIGSGNLTLSLCALGIQLSGSDLSREMLSRCREKAAARGISLPLYQADFRHLENVLPGQQFDCVGSTGNSLAYVTNEEIPGVLRQMDSCIRPGGWFYADLRNWDQIVQNRPRFYLYNPAFRGDVRINLVQVWDYLSDGSMDFNLLYAFERENRIVQKERFTEQYHPLPRRLLLDTLTALGYQNTTLSCMPAQFTQHSPEEAEWYCVMAQKPESNL